MYSIRNIKTNESVTFDHGPQIQVRMQVEASLACDFFSVVEDEQEM